MEPATGEVSDPDFTTHLAVASRMVGAAPALLNVKASSPEGLGALGRGQGMSAAAVVLLEAD